MDRIQKLRSGIDVSRMYGLEIGPLNKPVIRKSEGNILYVDYMDTDGLKKRHAELGSTDCIIDDIVGIDAIWGENTIKEAVGDDTQLDYVVASHVGEHVPDFLSWLQEISTILKPDGIINLALPDKRYCFDHLRDETGISDLLTAYFMKARRPQPQQIIDFCLHFHAADTQKLWRGLETRPALFELGQLHHAFAMAQSSLEGIYQDVHCWAFTPKSFSSVIEQARSLGIIDLICEEVQETAVDELEFFVTLKKDVVDFVTMK